MQFRHHKIKVKSNESHKIADLNLYRVCQKNTGPDCFRRAV